MQSEGVSNYNGLQVALQRRFTKGLAFDANYTWSKALSDITGFSQEGSQEGFSDADPTRLRQIEYGIAENDIQNRFALSLNYQFQYGKNWTGIAKEALAGWEINTISVFQSGKPFTILNNGGNAGPGNNDTTTYINPSTGQSVTESYGDRAVPNNGGGRDRPEHAVRPSWKQVEGRVLQHRRVRTSAYRGNRQYAAQLALRPRLPSRGSVSLQELSR